MSHEIKENTSAVGDKNNIFVDRKYIDMLYSEERRPKSDYPAKLAEHLKDDWYRTTGSLLDIGCGRGDMLKALFNTGYDVSGVDLSPSSVEYCRPHTVKTANFETDELPYSESSFDYVFSKSVIEHLHNPIPFLKQSLRVLRPGGKAIIMTPSWMHNYWGPFYLDCTHVTPFTIPSLRDAMNITGFQEVKVTHFRQLPFLWKHNWLRPVISVLSSFPLRYHPMYDVKLPQKLNTLFRFSKEVMLIGIGSKPQM